MDKAVHLVRQHGVAKAPAKPKKEGRDSIPESHRDLMFDYKFQKQSKHHPNGHINLKLADGEVKKYKPVKLMEKLPASHSLESHIPDVYDQGKIGACVAHTMAQALRVVLNHTHSQRYLSSVRSSGLFNPSRLYIYFNARKELGEDTSKDAGSTNYGGIMALKDYKAPEESLWPYETKLVTQRPSHDAYVKAALRTVFEYSEVDGTLHSLKDSINHGKPVTAGVIITPSFVKSGLNGGSGNVPLPDLEREEVLGGHSILLVGYDDASRTFTFVNHWGTKWGKNGFGTLPYDFITNGELCLSGDFYAIEKFA